MMDILPTFMSFANIPLAENSIDGKSLVDMITKDEKSPHDQVFWEYNSQLAVREGKWS